MKRFFTITILIFAASSSVFAMPSYSIQGTVMDSVSNKPVELASVVLRLKGEEKIVAAVAADQQGRFRLGNQPPGEYELTITYVGYQNKTIPLKLEGDISLGNIYLSSSNNLDEAVVVAQKSLITKNSEKTVYNVGQSPTNQTGTAEDVLRNMPGVSIDQNGNVSVVGKNGVRVLVDGRPNAMAENDLAGFLKSIPANSIEAIELITNPSAKYDAEGNAGIINIKLKKGKADGFNGTASAGAGYQERYVGNLSLNYRKNKINLFGDYSTGFQRNQNRYVETRDISIGDTVNHYNIDSRGKERRFGNNLKAGLDYFINDKNTLTYTLGGNYAQWQWNTLAEAQNQITPSSENTTYYSDNRNSGNYYSINNDLAYKLRLDSTGQELSANVIYTYVDSRANGRLNSEGYDSSGVLSEANSVQRRTATNNLIHNVITQLDYTLPLKWKGFKLEAGLKDEFTKNKNQFNAFRTLQSVEHTDSLLTNQFDYTENISALYLMLNGTATKWLTFSAGLRAEHTYIRSTNNSVNRQYLSLFPNATLNASLNESNSLSMSYSRRVQRPQFRQLNNSVVYIDQYSTWQGNPYLQPSFSHIVSLSYTLMAKQHMFSLEAMGNFQNGDFTESSRVDSNRITRGGFINGSDARIFNFTFFTRLQLTKWWDVQMNHNYSFSYYTYKTDVNTRPIRGHAYNLWLSTSVKFWKSAAFEINGWVNTGGVFSQGRGLPAGVMNVSVKKSFFKDRLTVAIAGQNILNTMKFRWTVSNTNLETVGSWHVINRNVTFTLSYRFGSAQSSKRREKEGNIRLEEGKGGR